MSIFGINSSFAIDAPAAMESYTEHGGDMVALEEAMEDMHSVVQSMHHHEMAAIECAYRIRQGGDAELLRESYGLVMEGAIKDIYDKLVAMLKKLWAKLKGYFKNVVRFFDALILSGKKFVKKYKKELERLSLSGYEYKMYDWNDTRLSNDPNVESYTTKVEEAIDAVAPIKVSAFAEAEEQVKTLTDKKDKILDQLRGSFVGGGAVASEDYSEKLFGYFRNGATGKEDLEDIAVDMAKIIRVLEEDKMLTTLKKAEKDCDKVFSKYIKDLEASHKSYRSAGSAVSGDGGDKLQKALTSVWAKKISIFNEGQAIAQAFLNAWKNAITERSRQYKGAAVAAFRFKEEQ